MGKKSRIRRRLRSVHSRFKTAKSDSYLSDSELLSIVNAATKIKLLKPSGRHLKKTDRILSKAVKWFSMTNITEVVNEVVKEVEVVNEVETPCETVYVDREVVKEVPTTYIIDPVWQVVNPEENQVTFTMQMCDKIYVDFFQAGDYVSYEIVATNFALDELINWSDFTSETADGPNNKSVTLMAPRELETCITINEALPWSAFSDEFLNLPRTFVAFVNETQQRQIAIEIEDLVGPMDSDA